VQAFLSMLIGFLSIALMITVHETGHFLVARAVGIKVEVFAIGWGKAIKRWRWQHTEIRINIFPLGGYCKLKGTEDLRRSLEKGEPAFVNAEEGSLFAVHPFKRILTYVAGPVFNLLFASIIFIPFFLLSYNTYADPNQIAISADYPQTFNIKADHPNAAQAAGLKTGDIILEIDGERVDDFFDIQNKLFDKKPQELTRFTLLREGQRFTKEFSGFYDESSQRTLFGISAYVPPIIGSVKPLSPESIAGLKERDRIVMVQGKISNNTLDVVQALSDNPTVITLVVEHPGGREEEITFHPEQTAQGQISLGFTFAREVKREVGLPLNKALLASVSQTSKGARDTLLLLPKLFSGMFAFDDVVAGPLRISYIIGESRTAGLRSILHLLAMVSISLAVANLLPIPGLDGGAILLSLLEIIRGKSVSPKMYVRFQSVGVIFLLLLMIFVVIGDVRFLFSGN
jgi:regulator of sigma E protease